MPKMTYAYGQVRNPSSGHIMMEMESNVMILSGKTIRVDRWVNKTSDFALETAVCEDNLHCLFFLSMTTVNLLTTIICFFLRP